MAELPVCVVCDHRATHRPQVCQPCRAHLNADITELAEIWASLSAEPGRRGTQRITGTREAPLGVRVPVLDHLLPAAPYRPVADPHGDQTGAIPTAVVLASWAADWLSHHSPPAPQPEATVPALARWLITRTEWACDHYPHIAAFATDVGHTLNSCRAAAQLYPERPELCDGVACATCDTRSLYRTAGRVHCQTCGRIYLTSEYQDWVNNLTQRLA